MPRNSSDMDPSNKLRAVPFGAGIDTLELFLELCELVFSVSELLRQIHNLSSLYVKEALVLHNALLHGSSLT